MKNIEIYSTDNCPWCVRAKTLLESKGMDYEERDISSDSARALEMVERSGRRTVPPDLHRRRVHRRVRRALGTEPRGQAELSCYADLTALFQAERAKPSAELAHFY